MPPPAPRDGERGRFLPGSPAHLLYNAVLGGALAVAAPAWIPWILLSPKRRKNFADRLGLRAARIPAPDGRPGLWIHGVSVGETLSAVPLVRALRERLGEARIVFSTVTLTGQEVAARALGDLSDGIFYFPFDLPGICGRVLDRVRPDAVVILETELWPNFLAECAKRRIPVVLLNARISERSLRGYGRFRGLFRDVLSCVSAISAQTGEDARRILSLGADPARVQATGNMKFDVAPPPESRSPFRSWLLAEKAAGTSWFVAGSTHQGEEEAVLAAFARAREGNRAVRLLLAPRHPERFDEVAELCARAGWEVSRRTQMGPEGGPSAGPVVLLDTVGELLSAYSAADVAFVGGSLVPKGGHNILEPALFGVPTLAGPHMDNFREIAEIFTGGDAVLLVRDASQLAARLAEWGADPVPYREMGMRAKALLDAFRGATGRNVEIVVRSLSARPGGAA